MKKKIINLLLCILNDSTRVFEKVKDRMPVYVEVFSEKREREQFRWVFDHSYKTLKLKDISKLPEDIIILSHDFYNALDDIFWFLMYTNEMPAAVQDTLTRSIYKLEKKLTTLTMAINEYLTPLSNEDTQEEEISEHLIEEVPEFNKEDLDESE